MAGQKKLTPAAVLAIRTSLPSPRPYGWIMQQARRYRVSDETIRRVLSWQVFKNVRPPANTHAQVRP